MSNDIIDQIASHISHRLLAAGYIVNVEWGDGYYCTDMVVKLEDVNRSIVVSFLEDKIDIGVVISYSKPNAIMEIENIIAGWLRCGHKPINSWHYCGDPAASGSDWRYHAWD